MLEEQSVLWDAVIIGGGMGGGAAAHRLTEHGLSVLLLELGPELPDPGEAHRDQSPKDTEESRRRAGMWPMQAEHTIDGTRFKNYPTIACGIGGSTLVYGATLERLAPEDFADAPHRADTLATWPFAYSEFEPHYADMERLFRIRGTADPLDATAQYRLATPPSLSEFDSNLFEAFQSSGMHPYRLHVGVRYDEGCTECGGHICSRGCKSDANTCLIQPAKKTGRLRIIDNARVIQLTADTSAVRSVLVERDHKKFQFAGKVIVLAAGALSTPGILTSSACKDWPDGIGNQHDQVGRNLMFHAFDLVAIWPTKRNLARQGPSRTLATRKFYRYEGKRLGYIHSTGMIAGYGEILHYLRQRFVASPFAIVPALRIALRVPAWIASRLFSDAAIFSTLVEDFPMPENRVVPCQSSPSGFAIHYTIPLELRERNNLMRDLMRKHLKRVRMLFLNRDLMLNYGHPCGTCRAGDDPRTSVVDANCKVHDMDNLYIADGSIFPTSGGVNPSLTIGANALRVADRIIERFRNGTL